MVWHLFGAKPLPEPKNRVFSRYDTDLVQLPTGYSIYKTYWLIDLCPHMDSLGHNELIVLICFRLSDLITIAPSEVLYNNCRPNEEQTIKVKLTNKDKKPHLVGLYQTTHPCRAKFIFRAPLKNPKWPPNIGNIQGSWELIFLNFWER